MTDLINGFFGILSPEQWEMWRNWLATLGGLIALAIALRTYWRNVRLKREEQARLVYAKVVHVIQYDKGDEIHFNAHGSTSGIAAAKYDVVLGAGGKPTFVAKESIIQPVLAVHNGSKELIGPLKIELVNRGKSTVYQNSALMALADPEVDTLVELTLTNDVAPGFPPLGARVIFRDASGSWWRRHLAEPIEPVHDDPENWVQGPVERESIRASQRARGIEPMEEPKVSLKVRWHRFWRARRGKSPVP